MGNLHNVTVIGCYKATDWLMRVATWNLESRREKSAMIGQLESRDLNILRLDLTVRSRHILDLWRGSMVGDPRHKSQLGRDPIF
jgi:hypothetical protein